MSSEGYHPAHYRIRQRPKVYMGGELPYDHVFLYRCPQCDGEEFFLMATIHRFIGQTVTCGSCGKSYEMPPVPCVDGSCRGTYVVCGGELERIDTSSMASGVAADYLCRKCGERYIYEPSPYRCSQTQCDTCGRDPLAAARMVKERTGSELPIPE